MNAQSALLEPPPQSRSVTLGFQEGTSMSVQSVLEDLILRWADLHAAYKPLTPDFPLPPFRHFFSLLGGLRSGRTPDIRLHHFGCHFTSRGEWEEKKQPFDEAGFERAEIEFHGMFSEQSHFYRIDDNGLSPSIFVEMVHEKAQAAPTDTEFLVSRHDRRWHIDFTVNPNKESHFADWFKDQSTHDKNVVYERLHHGPFLPGFLIRDPHHDYRMYFRYAREKTLDPFAWRSSINT